MLFRYTDNQLAQDAMNLTFFHWGVHGWIVYVVVGLLLAFVCYRQGLPMTVRSCFYPLIGDKIYGWMGDVIDILSICGTMFGVCTSLGLGAIQLNTGDISGWGIEPNHGAIFFKMYELEWRSFLSLIYIRMLPTNFLHFVGFVYR